MNTILEVSNLNKAYPDFSLSDVSFSIFEDCITGFIGTNGSGKTTTLRTILGLTKKDAGEIKLFGQSIEQHGGQLRNRLGIVFDDGCFYEELTMHEMKTIIAPAYSNWDDTVYHKYMELFSLNPKQVIATLSKGMKIKYALTIALSHHADFLIMDEPTSGLDPFVRSQLIDILNDYMKQGGKAVFYSTHITSDLEKAADMLVMIHNGQIIFQKDKDALQDEYSVVKGDSRTLTDELAPLFLKIEKTNFGFKGVTNQLMEVRRKMPDILVERPTIEDIMLAYVEKGK
ncbi:sodium ABC transporter ATP-binding protein [Bacillaceae bacterium SAOS 7]|nr:sodium ABC transporter ATP-binding protein [Bacillaceae bacterium SAOS 7]